MKKMFTLVAGVLFAAAVMAADRRPVVTINSSKNYKVVIDGRTYFGSNTTLNLDRFSGSMHTIKVFEMKKGRFGREVLVDATTFRVGKNDVMIRIDWSGNIMIREKKNFNSRGYGNNGNNDWNGRDDQDIRDDKSYDSRDDRNYDRRDKSNDQRKDGNRF